jgi:hypothetical protein
MNAVTDALLVHESLTSVAGLVAISAAGSSLERPRPAMTWCIDGTSGRPVARWVMLPAGPARTIDEC